MNQPDTRVLGPEHDECVEAFTLMRQQLVQVREELDRLHSWQGLMSILDEHYPAHIFTGESGASGDTGPQIVALVREVDRLRREVEFEALGRPVAVNGLSLPVCACISDDQATSLSPRFSRPVCAVHTHELPCGPTEAEAAVSIRHELCDIADQRPATPRAEGGEPE